MRQIVSAQNPVLLESRSLVDRFEVQDHGARVVLSQTVDSQRRQPERLDAILDARGADDADGLAFDLQPVQFVALDGGLRDDGRGRAGVDDEVERAASNSADASRRWPARRWCCESGPRIR